MLPSCHAQHDQPASPWVEHWQASQMPIFSLRSLLFIRVRKRSIDDPSARLRSAAVLQPPLAPSSSPPRLDHQSRSSIAMFTVFLSHNEICSRHHFSPVTLKVWQNFHTQVRAALQPRPPPLCLQNCSSAPLALSSYLSILSKSLSERLKFRFNHFSQPSDRNNRQIPSAWCGVNQLVMSVDWRENGS